MPKISIIIPVYNGEDVISNTIRNVIKQTYDDFEIIIINDGSSDNTVKRINEVKDGRVRLFSQSNQGVAVARNKGLSMAKGEYISFLDSDDYWDDTFLEKMLNAINHKDVVYCGHYFVNENGKKKKARIRYETGDILLGYIKNTCTPHTNSWLIRRSFIIKNKIFFPAELNWGEDMLFFAQLLITNTNIGCVKENLTYYNIGLPNTLSKDTLDKIDKHLLWMSYLIKNIKSGIEDKERKKRSLEAIYNYRLPAGIVYRLLTNFDKEDMFTMHKYYNDYLYILKQVTINNGIRSIKLVFNVYILKFKIFFNKLNKI